LDKDRPISRAVASSSAGVWSRRHWSAACTTATTPSPHSRDLADRAALAGRAAPYLEVRCHAGTLFSTNTSCPGELGGALAGRRMRFQIFAAGTSHRNEFSVVTVVDGGVKAYDGIDRSL
jgi:hypothetical protein